jgi:hypothetical protein
MPTPPNSALAKPREALARDPAVRGYTARRKRNVALVLQLVQVSAGWAGDSASFFRAAISVFISRAARSTHESGPD